MSEPVEALFALPSVASDCRPWSSGRSVRICSGCGVMKRVTNADFNPDVYKEYTSYPEPTGRTAKILEFVKDRMPAPKRALDIGAGNGHGMRVINEFYPDAMVFGYEPTINPERPNAKFDLITLFHVFEHVEDLHEMLAYIKSSLTEDGHVLIQVPYAAMWPFDLVIADHEWHFTPVALMQILDKCGFQHVDGWMKGAGVYNPIRKELTILAKIGESKPALPIGDWSEEKNPINWLLSFKSKLDNINEHVIVYGTSVSAMWVSTILPDWRIMNYYDDDYEHRRIFNGKAVSSPDYFIPSIAKEVGVIAPFPDWQLEAIKAKHPNLKFL